MTVFPPNPEVVYRLTAASEQLLVVEWDDFRAVYQRPSGETHAFNDATACFMDCLREGPGTLQQLVHRVATQFGVAAEELSPQNFGQVAERLEELGLIERADAGAPVS